MKESTQNNQRFESLKILIEFVKFKKQGQITNKSGDLKFSSGEIFQFKISFFKLKLRYMVNLKHNLCFTKT